jgi:leucyl/phenylalanyl-tRNA--protein transferase
VSRGFGPNELLECYRRGVFPMADSRDDPRLFLVDPDQRGVLPLDRIHVPRSLRKTILSEPYEVRIDTAFTRVVELCAEPGPGRENTWINTPILNLYSALHRAGHAHSIECWRDGELVGGLYGVSVQAAFFGESMFSRATDASKVALMYLCARLIRGGYRLLDTQFTTPHLMRFGVEEVDRDDFHERLESAMEADASFGDASWKPQPPEVLQLITQTS